MPPASEKTSWPRALTAEPVLAGACGDPGGDVRRVTVVSQYPALLEEASLAGFDTILNDRPEDGISRTIRLGTQAMADCAGILYMVADQPLLRAGTVRRVVDAWRANPDCIGRCGAQRKARQPVPVPGAVLPGSCAHWRLTAGGSSVIRRHEDALLLVEAGERELFDCDTKRRWRS